MRRRWPALAATIPLVLVWAVAIAHPASAAALGVRPGGPVSSLSTPRQNTTVTSSNWAGYVAAGASDTFTSASANWTEPVGRCTGQGGKYAAFWVGIDGYTSPTVEQIGTEVDCSGFYPRYYAWYEVYPGAGVNFPHPVSPGDRFAGSVTGRAGRVRPLPARHPFSSCRVSSCSDRRAAARPGWGCGRRSRSA